MSEPVDRVPLCVDLDGTLLRSDSLHESLWLLARQRPWVLIRLPVWVLKGKAQFKRQVATAITLPVEQLPYDDRVRRHIQTARESGQPVWLVSGCHQSIATRVAEFIGGFEGVMASDGEVNLTGTHKRDALCHRFGSGQYDYIGNSSTDIPVWDCARHVLVANARPSLLQQIRPMYNITHVFLRQ